MYSRNAIGLGKLSPAQVARRWPEDHPARDSLLYAWLLTRPSRACRQWAPNTPRLRAKLAA